MDDQAELRRLVREISGKLKEWGVVDFKLHKGDEWSVASPLQRARAIHDVVMAIDRGDIQPFPGIGDSVRHGNPAWE